MGFSSESLISLKVSLKSVDTLIAYAQEDKGDEFDNTRKLFLKLSIVLIVTRLQVFVEGVLKEFGQYLFDCSLNYSNLSVFAKLTSMRILLSELSLDKKLQNPESYNEARYMEIKGALDHLQSHFESEVKGRNLNFKGLFPLGKTGSGELIELFKQFEGINIFDNTEIDIEVLNSLLLTRHLIIHHDISKELTEKVVCDYREYIEKLSDFIENYLEGIVSVVGVRT